MLSNDLLIEQLQKAETDQVFQEYIDAAIVQDNAELAEELALLNEQLEQERSEKAKLEEQKTVKEKELSDAQVAIQEYKQINANNVETILRISIEADSDRQLREAAEEHAAHLERESVKVKEKYKTFLMVVISILLNGVIITIFEVVIYRVPWNWLVNHPDSYGLQVSVDAIITAFIFGIFLPKWRKWCWGAVGLSLFAVILQLLGGPS